MKRKAHQLYSFRRCPYAMRARMAMVDCSISFELIDIELRNKPEAMLALSPKGTVPVLHLVDGSVIDESLDIMRWAMGQHDPRGWVVSSSCALELIADNDGWFKRALDRYKYPNRFEGEDCCGARDEGEWFLRVLEERLSDGYLAGDALSFVDLAIFPFIRQFANVDRAWFVGLSCPRVQKWLSDRLESDLFVAIMRKSPQ